MKKLISLLSLLSFLSLAGCCSPSHSAKWEYKVVAAPWLTGDAIKNNNALLNSTNFLVRMQESQRISDEHIQGYLNGLGKDGWQLVSVQDGAYYLKRRLK